MSDFMNAFSKAENPSSYIGSTISILSNLRLIGEGDMSTYLDPVFEVGMNSDHGLVLCYKDFYASSKHNLKELRDWIFKKYPNQEDLMVARGLLDMCAGAIAVPLMFKISSAIHRNLSDKYSKDDEKLQRSLKLLGVMHNIINQGQMSDVVHNLLNSVEHNVNNFTYVADSVDFLDVNESLSLGDIVEKAGLEVKKDGKVVGILRLIDEERFDEYEEPYTVSRCRIFSTDPDKLSLGCSPIEYMLDDTLSRMKDLGPGYFNIYIMAHIMQALDKVGFTCLDFVREHQKLHEYVVVLRETE